MVNDKADQTLGNEHIDLCWKKLNNLPEDEEEAYDCIVDQSNEFHLFASSETEYYSKENFDFLLKILSDEKLCALEGVYWFIFNFRIDNQKLTEKQNSRLLNCIVDNYKLYKDEGLEGEIAECISKYTSPETALSIFDKIAQNNPTNCLRSIWRKVRNILEEEEKSAPNWEQARQLFNKLQNRYIPKKRKEEDYDDLGPEGMGVDKCWEKFGTLPNKSVGKYIENLAFQLSVGQLLGPDKYSQTETEFFLRLFQNKYLCSQRGTNSFVSLLYDDSEKLTDQQKNEFLDCFLNNYHLYSGKDLRLFIHDFVGRCFEAKVALEFFEFIEQKFDDNDIDQILVGIEIILWHTEKKSEDWERAKILYFKVQDRFAAAKAK